MMFKLFDYEIYFRRNSTEWASADKPHAWSFEVEFLWLSPEEKEHRAEWQKEHPNKHYPTY